MKRKETGLPFLLAIYFISVFCPAGVSAQEIKKYTLSESIAEAIAKNWSLKAKKEAIVQSKEIEKQAKSEFFPKLSMSYGYTRLNEARQFRSSLTPGQKIAVSTEDNYRWVGTVTQPLFTGFALLSSYELARLGIDKAELEVDLEKLDLALRVKEAYFNILISDAGIEVAKKDVEARESNLKVARSFYEVGMVPINQVLRAEVELGNAQQNLVSSRNLARLARSAFNTVLAREVSAPVDVVLPEPPYVPEHGQMEVYVEKALQNRPEMKVLDIGILQTDQEIRLARSEKYPDVYFTYDYIKEGDGPDVSGSRFHDANRWEASAGLTWTFWEWGKTRAAVREKESLKHELLQMKRSLEDDIRLQVRDAVLRLENAEENIPTTKKAVEQGEENLRVNEERYKAQVTTITEVLDAQSLLTRARVDYISALYNHNLAKASLLRALGEY